MLGYSLSVDAAVTPDHEGVERVAVSSARTGRPRPLEVMNGHVDPRSLGARPNPQFVQGFASLHTASVLLQGGVVEEEIFFHQGLGVLRQKEQPVTGQVPGHDRHLLGVMANGMDDIVIHARAAIHHAALRGMTDIV